MGFTMKFAPYLLKHLRRNWLRTTSTVLAMAVCIFLFCTLRTVLKAMDDAREYGNVTRLVTRHSVSLVYNLPLSYEGPIAQVPGVKRVAISSWFGGSLPAKRESKDAKAGGAPDFSKFFTNLGVEDEPYFTMHPEFKIPPEEMQAFREDLRGCIIGRGLAQQFGWKPGDAFFLESFIPPYRRREGPFEFVVRGIYDADLVREPAADNRVMYFHYKYLYEGTGRRVGAGLYVVELQDPTQAAAVARAIDTRFENSEAGTKTETEAAFRAEFMAMIGNLALRFSSATVMGLILGEALLIAGLGGGIGLGLSALIIRALPNVPSIGAFIRGFPSFGLHWSVTSQGLGIALVLGLAAGFLPALAAYRSRIVDMLRQV